MTQNVNCYSTLCVRKYRVSDLSSCAGSELGSELTSLAGSELGSELTSLADIECAGSDTRPPILGRTDFASWYNADIQATNILLQGLPKDIYSLINHYTDSKDIWDNVKMLLEGSELTKEDRESQLHDDFKHFRQNKGETIHDYYVRFVTAVKPNKGLRDSNYDQLYAYLKQHELHYPSSSTTSPSTYVQPDSADTIQLDSGLSLTENLIENLTNTLALLTQSYKTYLPQTNNQLRTISNSRNQATIQDGKVVVQNVQGRQNRGHGNNAWGAGAAGYGGAQNRVGYANPEYFKDKMLLMQAQENGVALDEEQSLFIAGGQDNAVDEDVDEQPVQDLALNVDNVFQVDDSSLSYDSDVLSEVHDHDHYQDTICEHLEYVKDNAMQVVQSDVSAVPNDAYMMILNDMHEPPAQHVYVPTQTKKENQHLEEFLDMKALKEKAEDKLFKQDQSLQTVHMLCKPKPYYDEQRKATIGYKSPLCLARAKQVQPALYNGHEIIKTDHVPVIVQNSEDTLEIAEITRKKINEKMKTPLWTHLKSISDPQITPKRIF
uniref:Retrovirus-related Pol polyprotein from transposon TNT 1-94 n=1 Tax=Tanacetum cinerariifolium TaxID=118510 RepID=A0A6L2J9Y3_TANCI|nr:hypothetical protein [Tanacetum cinerariifolium]